MGVYTCVLLGEKGSGKTAFLNLLGSMPVVLNTGQSQMEAVGPGPTEAVSVHEVRGLDFGLAVIDTPGLGGPEGVDADSKCLESVRQAIQRQESIHCVVLVLNGRVARVKPSMRYVLSTIGSILPKEALGHVIVVFTRMKDPQRDMRLDLASPEMSWVAQVPQGRRIFINNPWTRLEAEAQLRESGENSEERLRSLREEFAEAARDLAPLFKLSLSIPAVPAGAFSEVFAAKLSVDQDLTVLAREQEQLRDVRLRAEALERDLMKVHESMRAAEPPPLPPKVLEEEWGWEPTEGRYHTVCNECKSNCHVDCEVRVSANKACSWRTCRCFQWMAPKTLSIRNEEDRLELLSNIFDDTKADLLHVETGEVARHARRVYSVKNFSINGVTVRGDPDSAWIDPIFTSGACCREDGTTVESLDRRTLPFDITFHDWSNAERGADMLCCKCGHSLRSHSRQARLHQLIRKPEPPPDDGGRGKLDDLISSDAEIQQYMDMARGRIYELERSSAEGERQLGQDLSRFEGLAACPSYAGLLADRRQFVLSLKGCVRGSDATDAASSLAEQLGSMETALAACPVPAAATSIPGIVEG